MQFFLNCRILMSFHLSVERDVRGRDEDFEACPNMVQRLELIRTGCLFRKLAKSTKNCCILVWAHCGLVGHVCDVVIKLVVGCHNFIQDSQLPSQLQSISAVWLISNYPAWWQEARVWHSIVVRPLVLADELSLSCTILMAGRVTTLWVKRPLSVNQQGQRSLPSVWGR